VRGWSGFELADIRAQALVAMEDLTRAVHVVRESTSDRVGTLGFSAGGLLTIATAAGTEPPDFAAALYGPVWHPVTVPSAPPPLFLALAGDDQGDGVVDGNLAVYRDVRPATLRPCALPVSPQDPIRSTASSSWPPTAASTPTPLPR
jgi:acetyl esterase/lipase